MYVRALTSGAVSVLPRAASPDAVREAFEAVVDGKSILPTEVLAVLTGLRVEARQTTETPSTQDIAWLHHLADGFTVGQLAARVGYSERMMFRLLRDLYDRLRVKGRTEALMLAKDRGWL
jgi:DNA-binding NarL/FixJ family response regulator